LLSNIDLDLVKKAALNQAKNEIRQILKTRLPIVLLDIAGQDAVTEPRFFTQGSWAYKTINEPAQYPQQADLDDGAYLPLSFLTELHKPSFASKIYFEAVEKVLRPLVASYGWKLITDKPTCIRIEVDNESHIDIPLYAIPDKEFETLTKAAAARYKTLDVALRESERDAWTALPKNLVLLAHREEDWKVSDPRLIKDWFLRQVDLKGEQLRRVVRYLKAYRDQQWNTGGPSSILLMVAAESVFEKRERRDDLALLDVVRKIPYLLRKGIYNPTEQSESLTDRLEPQDLDQIANKFEEFCKYLSGCIQATDKEQACNWMCSQFGTRFPFSPDRVQLVSAVETIASAAPVYIASPLVGRTQAG
jgi:hypothetical protein